MYVPLGLKFLLFDRWRNPHRSLRGPSNPPHLPPFPPTDNDTRRLGVPTKPDHHGGSEHGALVQLRRAQAAESGGGQEDQGGIQSRGMIETNLIVVWCTCCSGRSPVMFSRDERESPSIFCEGEQNKAMRLCPESPQRRLWAVACTAVGVAFVGLTIAEQNWSSLMADCRVVVQLGCWHSPYIADFVCLFRGTRRVWNT